MKRNIIRSCKCKGGYGLSNKRGKSNIDRSSHLIPG